MKTWILAGSLLLTGFFASAQEFPPIANLCTGPRCTDTMRSIVADFERAPGFFPVDQLPQVASGSCYHIHDNLDPNHEHHGMFLFDLIGNQPSFNGVFSFFNPQNPYSGFTVEDARRRLYGDETPTIKPILFEGNEGRGYIPSETAKLYYWFKTDPETRQLYLLTLWSFQSGGGSGQRSFCRFTY